MATNTQTARRLRRDMTAAERTLWHAIRSKQLAGAKFRRQVPIGAYIADFASLEAKLLIEVDVQSVFVNCARYVHKHSRAETSPYTPTEPGNQPIPSWKRIDGFQSSLPENDRLRVAKDGGTISAEDYGEKLRNGYS